MASKSVKKRLIAQVGITAADVKKPKVVIVASSSGDWEGVYVDGILKREGHSIDADEVLEILGIDVESKSAADDFVEDLGSLPDKLEDVKF